MRFLPIELLAAKLGAAAITMDMANHRALERAAKIVADEAKNSLGTYQEAAGPFPAWEELAPTTKADRQAKGFSQNEPLLRTGELRDSIGYTVTDDTATIGATAPHAAFHELGTDSEPQRSFLGSAAYRKGDEVSQEIGATIITHIIR